MFLKQKQIFYSIIIILILLCFKDSYAQIISKNLGPDLKFAKYCLMFKNYNEGLAEYLKLIEEDSLNVTYRYHIGICHMNLNEDKSRAIPYFEWVVKQKDYDINVWYDLGKAYTLVYRFDDAIKAFEKYKSLSNDKDKKDVPVDRMIEMCNNAKEAVKHPVNVSFENLGDKINSKYPDYNPYIPQDESILIFTSQRRGNIGNYVNLDGYITADLYNSYFKSGKWKKVRRFTPKINTALVEEIVGMSADGSCLFLYFDNFIGENDIYISYKRGKGYLQALNAGINVNTNAHEYSAAITPDRNILFFVSDRHYGIGGKDIYMSKRLPTGQWGPAENIGNTINTVYDEDFPYLAPDGKTLYFCSVGHNSMGGSDIFKTIWDRTNNTWSTPVNLGYPINTPDDNKTICFTQSDRYAYISALRKEGVGNLDIYRVIFNDIEPQYTVLKGGIFNNDSINIVDIQKINFHKADSLNTILYAKAAKFFARKDSVSGNKILEDVIDIERDLKAKITVINKRNDKIFGNYLSNKITGKYTIILPPGDYKIIFYVDGYNEYIIENFHIIDRDNRETSIIKQILLESVYKENTIIE